MIIRYAIIAVFSYVFLFASLPVYAGETGSGYAEVNGTKLYYEIKGEGAPIVFIHSGGFDRRIWDEQFEVFSKKYKVIRYDVRGHGKSPSPTRPYSEQEDLYRLLNYLNIGKANIVGLSLGGRIAIDFTIMHPDMVESLVAAAPGLSGYPYSAEDLASFAMVVYSIQKDDGSPAGETWLQSPYNAPAMENQTAAKILRPIAVENSRFWLVNPLFALPIWPPAAQRISEISVPTMLVIGDRDLPTIQSIVKMLEAGIPGVSKTVIPGAGHMVNVEKPEQFDSALQDFLERVEKGNN